MDCPGGGVGRQSGLLREAMKPRVRINKEIEVHFVRVTLPVCYGTEDMPEDFFGRSKDVWRVTIDIETGKIIGWKGESFHLHMKVCDGGRYVLKDGDSDEIDYLHDYVPHGLIPGECGDYVDLHIDATGRITNWPKQPDLSAFFKREE